MVLHNFENANQVDICVFLVFIINEQHTVLFNIINYHAILFTMIGLHTNMNILVT
jgi:hypothetical protein